MKHESNIPVELTPLSEKDCFYIADRKKKEFTYPIHRHDDFELNFVANANGVKRIVGESEEIIGDYDLVLIANGSIEHGWLQNECVSRNIREITIQFLPDLFVLGFTNKSQFDSIRKMLSLARNGLSFPLPAIMKVYPMLDKLASEQSSFYAVLNFLSILYELSLFLNDATVLTTNPYARKIVEDDTLVVKKMQSYIEQYYRDNLSLEHLASMFEMSPTAVSRSFSQEMGVTLSEYIIETRLLHATRLLTDTSTAVAEICNECGFKNISNFNRQFKKKKGCSPSEFRDNYSKKKLLI